MNMGKVGPILASICVILGGAALYKGKSDIAKQKNEISMLDSARYESASKRLKDELIVPINLEDFGHNYSTEVNFWEREYRAVKDSIAALNSESAKKAYLKSSQIVNDSVKNVLKSVK